MDQLLDKNSFFKEDTSTENHNEKNFIEKIYKERFKILSNTINEICEKMKSDKMINLMKEESITEGFIFPRIEEIIENCIFQDKQILINKFANKYKNLKKKSKNYLKNVIIIIILLKNSIFIIDFIY